MQSHKELGITEIEPLLEKLNSRFETSRHRLNGLTWEDIRSRLQETPEKLWVINQMEITGGEPGFLEFKNDQLLICDMSKESPAKRRSLCYDEEALESRKKHKPAGSALGMATMMGLELMSEQQYRSLQSIAEVDTKTSSWLKTPAGIRNLGGAIFGDFRYGQVFIYHNGAESYYAARGFRGILEL